MAAQERSFHVWDCELPLAYECPFQWDELERTQQVDVRHCRKCHREVYRCRTPSDFVEHAEQGHCVAIGDDLSPGLHLGEPPPEVELENIKRANLGEVWWTEILARQTALDAGQIQSIQSALEVVKLYLEPDPIYVGLLEQAVRDGALHCPLCGRAINLDRFGMMVLQHAGHCETCEFRMEKTDPRRILK